jgi:hypothetical protein
MIFLISSWTAGFSVFMNVPTFRQQNIAFLYQRSSIIQQSLHTSAHPAPPLTAEARRQDKTSERGTPEDSRGV